MNESFPVPYYWVDAGPSLNPCPIPICLTPDVVRQLIPPRTSSTAATDAKDAKDAEETRVAMEQKAWNVVVARVRADRQLPTLDMLRELWGILVGRAATQSTATQSTISETSWRTSETIVPYLRWREFERPMATVVAAATHDPDSAEADAIVEKVAAKLEAETAAVATDRKKEEEEGVSIRSVLTDAAADVCDGFLSRLDRFIQKHPDSLRPFDDMCIASEGRLKPTDVEWATLATLGHIPTRPAEIDAEMKMLWEDLQELVEDDDVTKDDVYTLAAYVHIMMVHIRPFPHRGNGRMARLMMNWVLIYNGYLPIPCCPRVRYLRAVRDSDEGEHITVKPMIDFIAEQHKQLATHVVDPTTKKLRPDIHEMNRQAIADLPTILSEL